MGFIMAKRKAKKTKGEAEATEEPTETKPKRAGRKPAKKADEKASASAKPSKEDTGKTGDSQTTIPSPASSAGIAAQHEAPALDPHSIKPSLPVADQQRARAPGARPGRPLKHIPAAEYTAQQKADEGAQTPGRTETPVLGRSDKTQFPAPTSGTIIRPGDRPLGTGPENIPPRIEPNVITPKSPDEVRLGRVHTARTLSAGKPSGYESEPKQPEKKPAEPVPDAVQSLVEKSLRDENKELKESKHDLETRLKELAEKLRFSEAEVTIIYKNLPQYSDVTQGEINKFDRAIKEWNEEKEVGSIERTVKIFENTIRGYRKAGFNPLNPNQKDEGTTVLDDYETLERAAVGGGIAKARDIWTRQQGILVDKAGKRGVKPDEFVPYIARMEDGLSQVKLIFEENMYSYEQAYRLLEELLIKSKEIKDAAAQRIRDKNAAEREKGFKGDEVPLKVNEEDVQKTAEKAVPIDLKIRIASLIDALKKAPESVVYFTRIIAKGSKSWRSIHKDQVLGEYKLLYTAKGVCQARNFDIQAHRDALKDILKPGETIEIEDLQAKLTEEQFRHLVRQIPIVIKRNEELERIHNNDEKRIDALETTVNEDSERAAEMHEEHGQEIIRYRELTGSQSKQIESAQRELEEARKKASELEVLLRKREEEHSQELDQALTQKLQDDVNKKYMPLITRLSEEKEALETRLGELQEELKGKIEDEGRINTLINEERARHEREKGAALQEKDGRIRELQEELEGEEATITDLQVQIGEYKKTIEGLNEARAELETSLRRAQEENAAILKLRESMETRARREGKEALETDIKSGRHSLYTTKEIAVAERDESVRKAVADFESGIREGKNPLYLTRDAANDLSRAESRESAERTALEIKGGKHPEFITRKAAEEDKQNTVKRLEDEIESGQSRKYITREASEQAKEEAVQETLKGLDSDIGEGRHPKYITKEAAQKLSKSDAEEGIKNIELQIRDNSHPEFITREQGEEDRQKAVKQMEDEINSGKHKKYMTQNAAAQKIADAVKAALDKLNAEIESGKNPDYITTAEAAEEQEAAVAKALSDFKNTVEQMRDPDYVSKIQAEEEVRNGKAQAAEEAVRKLISDIESGKHSDYITLNAAAQKIADAVKAALDELNAEIESGSHQDYITRQSAKEAMDSTLEGAFSKLKGDIESGKSKKYMTRQSAQREKEEAVSQLESSIKSGSHIKYVTIEAANQDKKNAVQQALENLDDEIESGSHNKYVAREQADENAEKSAKEALASLRADIESGKHNEYSTKSQAAEEKRAALEEIDARIRAGTHLDFTTRTDAQKKTDAAVEQALTRFKQDIEDKKYPMFMTRAEAEAEKRRALSEFKASVERDQDPHYMTKEQADELAEQSASDAVKDLRIAIDGGTHDKYVPRQLLEDQINMAGELSNKLLSANAELTRLREKQSNLSDLADTFSGLTLGSDVSAFLESTGAKPDSEGNYSNKDVERARKIDQDAVPKDELRNRYGFDDKDIEALAKYKFIIIVRKGGKPMYYVENPEVAKLVSEQGKEIVKLEKVVAESRSEIVGMYKRNVLEDFFSLAAEARRQNNYSTALDKLKQARVILDQVFEAQKTTSEYAAYADISMNFLRLAMGETDPDKKKKVLEESVKTGERAYGCEDLIERKRAMTANNLHYAYLMLAEMSQGDARKEFEQKAGRYNVLDRTDCAKLNLEPLSATRTV